MPVGSWSSIGNDSDPGLAVDARGVSGHLADGTPTSAPHVAFLALPYVGREHADGRIMGLVISLPGELDAAARQATLRGIGKWEQERGDRPLQLRMGPGGTVEMMMRRRRRRQPPFALVSLRSWVWARPSRCTDGRRLPRSAGVNGHSGYLWTSPDQIHESGG